MIQEEETVPVLVSNMLAGASPAFGMLGTLMGLIVMLGNFNDTSGLASGMALALMTTFYGMMFTQFFWFPLAKKFTRASRLNTRRRERELAAILLLLEGKPDMYISDQLTTMSRD
jgi:chemotaxis protein MotA